MVMLLNVAMKVARLQYRLCVSSAVPSALRWCDSQEPLPLVKCALLYGRSSDSHPDSQIRTSAVFLLQLYRFVVFFIFYLFLLFSFFFLLHVFLPTPHSLYYSFSTINQLVNFVPLHLFRLHSVIKNAFISIFMRICSLALVYIVTRCIIKTIRPSVLYLRISK